MAKNNVKINSELHKKLKVCADKQGMKMEAIAERGIEKELARYAAEAQTTSKR